MVFRNGTISAILLFVGALVLLTEGCAESNPIPLQFEKGLQDAIAKSRSSIVAIEVSTNDTCHSSDSTVCRGAGVVISNQGLIVTTCDYLDYGSGYTVLFQDGCGVQAELIGCDFETNIALLMTPKHVCGCFPIELLIEDKVLSGSLGILASNSVVSKGVSAGMGLLAESWLGGDDGCSDQLLIIQTGDILTMPGAPVISFDGKLIGICDAMIESHQGSWLVIPARTILKISDQLSQYGEVKRSWIGVSCTVEDEEPKGTLGVKYYIRISDVVPSSPAEKAGLVVGDFIVAVNSRNITDLDELRREIAASAIGSTVSLDVLGNSGRVVTKNLTATPLPVDRNRQRLCRSRSL